MNRYGTIQTWSLATGAKLYNLNTEKFTKRFEDFEVYQSSDVDPSYKRDYFNFRHKSRSLIISKMPIKDSVEL